MVFYIVCISLDFVLRYHRILRKAKQKEELKKAEELQKTDPEAATEQMRKIEKARAEERISLRHKGTSKWAKQQAIYHKNDATVCILNLQRIHIKDKIQLIVLRDNSRLSIQ